MENTISNNRIRNLAIIAHVDHGKTSLLEAVYMLTKQNDISSILKLIQLKNKLNKLSPKWLNKVFTKNIEIKGRFNNLQTSVKMEKFEANNIDKKNCMIKCYTADIFKY